MPTRKKILLATGGALAALLVALLLLPALFVGQIESRVRTEIERSGRVRVSWADVGLSFFRDFPHPTLTLTGLDVVGTGRFDGDTLASVGDFRLSMNGTSVLGAVRGSGPLVVRSVSLDQPKLRLEVDEDGTASWDVLPQTDDAQGGPSGAGVSVSLQSFELRNGTVVLENAASGLFVSLEGLRHSLSGNFSRASLVARTETHADAATVTLAGTPYLGGVSLDFDADFDVDMTEQRALLTDNELRLNDLVVRLGGEVAREGEDVALSLTFAAPSTEFGEVLSLMPMLYARDFASLETSGTFSLEGSVQGSYGESAFPAFTVELTVADGSFRYPDLPLPAQSIAADLAITNPGGDVDSTVVNLSRFHVEIGEQPIDAALTLRTPVSDPDVDGRMEGTIDLGAVARTVKLENAEGLGGVVTVDASMRARLSDVDNERYDRIAAQGEISARDVTLRGDALRQPVDVQEARIRLTPRTAELQAFDAQLGSSDLRATGRLDNLLGFALGSQPLSGAGEVASGRVDLDEWRSEEEATAIPVPPMLDLTLDGTFDELVLNGVESRNARGRMIVRDRRLTLESFTLETLGGRVGMDGFYETLDPAGPTFALDLVLDSLDIAATSEALVTVRTLAPVARYASGTFSTDLALTGALGQDLAPAFDVLDGDGSIATSRLAIEGFPMLDRLAERFPLQDLTNPTVQAIRSGIRIEDGRLFVHPFQANVGGLPMAVSGSNGFDQSIDYTLGLQVPRAGFAEGALSALASAAGPLGTRLSALDPVPVAVRVSGTVEEPSLTLGLSDASGSVSDAATQSVQTEVGERVDEARERVDAEREEALRRARAEADSIVAAAERQAEQIRAEAATAAAAIRAEGDRAAEELLARATNPLARAAAQPAADLIRGEADERAATLEREADERATALVAAAQARADALIRDAGGG